MAAQGGMVVGDEARARAASGAAAAEAYAMGALGRLAGAPSRRRAERLGCVDWDPGPDTGQLCTRVGQVSAKTTARGAERSVAGWT